MPEAVIIRPATREDLHSLTILLKTVSSRKRDICLEEGLQLRGLEGMLNNGRGCILVAEADGTVVGMCSGQLVIHTAEGGPAVLIEDIVIHQGWRDQGLGSKLMEGVGAWARDRKFLRLQLLADRNNVPAIEFYKSLGWEQAQHTCPTNRLEP